jgi:hypothetical protein
MCASAGGLAVICAGSLTLSVVMDGMPSCANCMRRRSLVRYRLRTWPWSGPWTTQMTPGRTLVTKAVLAVTCSKRSGSSAGQHLLHYCFALPHAPRSPPRPPSWRQSLPVKRRHSRPAVLQQRRAADPRRARENAAYQISPFCPLMKVAPTRTRTTRWGCADSPLAVRADSMSLNTMARPPARSEPVGDLAPVTVRARIAWSGCVPGSSACSRP